MPGQNRSLKAIIGLLLCGIMILVVGRQGALATEEVVAVSAQGEKIKVSRCQTEVPSEQDLTRMLFHEKQSLMMMISSSSSSNDASVYVFPLVFHIFENVEGYITVPDAAVSVQVDHLNAAFASSTPDSGIRFTLREIKRYVNDTLSIGCLHSAYKLTMFQLASLQNDAVHVFVCNMMRGGQLVLGQARLPCSEDFHMRKPFDGAVWVHFGAFRDVPGVYEAVKPYNEGDTLVHVSLFLADHLRWEGKGY